MELINSCFWKILSRMIKKSYFPFHASFSCHILVVTSWSPLRQIINPELFYLILLVISSGVQPRHVFFTSTLCSLPFVPRRQWSQWSDEDFCEISQTLIVSILAERTFAAFLCLLWQWTQHVCVPDRLLDKTIKTLSFRGICDGRFCHIL